MRKRESWGFLGLGFEWQVIFWLSIWLAVSQQAMGLRPIREKTRSWSDEVCVFHLMIASKFSSFCSTIDQNWLSLRLSAF